jgi:predicted RNase H-like HicB family nuclease
MISRQEPGRVSRNKLDGQRTDMRYTVIIERAPENYAAYVPDLPGCIATGDSREEVEQNIREAILFHLETLREDGFPFPEPTTESEVVDVSL